MLDNPALRRLACLDSYRRLTQTQRTAVRLHVGKQIPGEEAMSLAGDPNPARSWRSSRVQRCLTEFHNTAEEKSIDELVMEFEQANLEAARAEWMAAPQPEKPALEPPTIAPEPPPEPPTPPPDPVAPPKPPQPFLQREPRPPVGGPVTFEQIFPRNERDWGMDRETSVQMWRQQDQAEQIERERLLRQIADGERRRRELL